MSVFGHDDQHIRNMYDMFIRCNSMKHNISADRLLGCIKMYSQSRNYFLPEQNPENFFEGDIAQGRDFCMYCIDTATNGVKYWKKL